MFPNGWPGTGLLLLRIASGAFLIGQGLTVPSSIVQPVEVLAGAFLIVGLWTPVAGAVVAIGQTCAAIMVPDDSHSAVLLAIIGAALAMLGPGATSLDNQLFGRKRLAMPKA
jgi:uncharacterized membrane protein YphA (DoxX/SURF4 family)